MNSWIARICLAYTIGLFVNSVVAWPAGYGRQDEQEDYPMAYDRNNEDVREWMRDASADSPVDPEDNSLLPQLTLEELQAIVEMASQRESDLPRAKFTPVGPDATNNGGAGPFKLTKPTPAPVVQTRSPPPVKKHIATISDETPLYLNYAEKEDGGPHRPVGMQAAVPAKPAAGLPERTLVLLPEVNTKPLSVEEEDSGRSAETGNAEGDDGDSETQTEEGGEDTGLPSRPEIDFTQRLAFPDFSGTDIQPARLNAEEDAAEEVSQEDAGVDEKKTEEDANESETAAVNEAETAGASEASLSGSAVPLMPTPADVATDPLVVHVVGAPAPQHLAQPNDISFIPSPEYGFFLKTVGEKRAQEATATTGKGMSSITLPIVFACTGSILFACIAAAIIHRRNSRKQTLSDAEEPSYGVTGPGPIKPTFLDLSGDRSLAKSAETYHYQHQKRQILSSVENNPSSGGSTATPRSGDHSDYDSDEDEEEGEDYGDYTVYECPGLAPAGEIEVLNPMFAGAAASNKESNSSVNDE